MTIVLGIIAIILFGIWQDLHSQIRVWEEYVKLATKLLQDEEG